MKRREDSLAEGTDHNQCAMPGLGGEEKKRATWGGEAPEGWRVIKPKGKKLKLDKEREGEGETEEGKRQDKGWVKN